jgi:UDP-glucose 6-dehydrogenase
MKVTVFGSDYVGLVTGVCLAEVGNDVLCIDNAVENINDRQKQVLFNKIVRHYDGDLQSKTFALWGLAFKPKTDDMREAPSRVILEAFI